jgi:hypothetical protein
MAERDRDGRTVEDRVNMERPCRTLFIRNVSVRHKSFIPVVRVSSLIG